MEEDSPIHHVGVTTMERPDQSSLHPSIKHRETDISAGVWSPVALAANQADNLQKSYIGSLLLPILNLYMIFNF
jgi:hypothetical protein